MRRSIWKRIEEILQKHVLHGKWVRAVIALACVVIYITTYVLIMPAVTLARATECGQEEHIHTEDCYETETELTCGQEEHAHTDDCYDEEGNLICGMEEHVHDDSCYTSREVLVCGQEEHVHTEDCYAEEEPVQEDIQEEAEEEEQEEFTVENEEEQPQAGDTVMEPASTAAPEQLSQIRFRDYLTDWTTLYYAPEDGDNWQPLAEDKWHPLYEDNWGIRRSDTADRGLDPEEYVLLHIGYRIPAGQINATNPEAEFILPLSVRMTEEEVRDNNNNNNTLFRGTDREADELFVDGEYEIKEEWNSDGEVTQRKLVITFNEDACLRCGGEKLTDGTETLAAEELEGFFELRVKAENLLTLKKTEEASYVLEWNDEEELDTVVRFDPEKLAAYYDAKNGDSAETDTDAEKPVPGELRAEGEDYTITVSYTEEAGLPADVSLNVKEITKEKEYESYKAQMEEELIDPESTKVTGARFFDITLEDSEGNELHPESGVRVLIETKDTLQENEKVQICHFDEEKDKPVEVESLEVTGETYEEENLGVEFEAESFSVYGVVYTVDFHYEVNGKMYQFSLPGGGFVSFTDLVEVLGIIGDTNSGENGDENGAVIAENAEEDATNEGAEESGVNSNTNTSPTLSDVKVSESARKFVADVASVEFSSPELMDVSKVGAETTVGQIKESRGLECEYSAELTEEQIAEINAQMVEAGDWALISLKAFDTEEYMTVTMKTGEVFQINVTDDQENPLGLDGKSFAITANKNNQNYYLSSDGNGISSTNSDCLKANNYNPNDWGTPTGSVWTFEWTGKGKKYLIHDNQNRYILIENNKVSLTDDRNTALANPITIVSREGKYSFVNEKNNQALNIYGSSGFGRWDYNEGNPDFLMTLQNPSNLKKPGTIATADTSGLLQINLFDYGPENELDKETYNNTNPYSGGINSGHTLKFFSYGKNVGTGINDFTGQGNGPHTGIVADQLSGNYPVLASNPSESLGYLFGGETNSNVTPYTGLNYLFTKDENGYYHYNSDQNYAYLDGSNFKVYSKTFPEEGADEQYFGVGFFPFNDYDEYYNCIHGKDGFERWDPHSNGTNPKKNGHYNHHFGMSLKGNFIMPPGGQYNGKDVTFQFSGDDDMWVYVDGVLIMDIGGVHNPVHGEINFTTGEVTVHGAAQENFKEKYKRITGNDWDDSDFSNHDFRVFYMERGGMYSNLEVTFNLPLTPKTETNNFQFDKVSSENESLKLSGAEFSLFNDSSCSDPFTLASVPVKATSDKNGVVSFKNIPHGTYYMKETVYPEGYQAKTPEEIFTVVVNASGGTITSSSGDSISQVANKPKKIDVEVEKVWSNGIVPNGAEIEIVLGRYKLVEDPNAPGTATLVIKDSYTGLPSGSNYHVTYTITGPDGYSNTITKSYTDSSKQIEESVEVPATVAGSQYTVTKQVQNISYHNINNQNQTVNVTVAKNGTGQTQFNQSTFTRNAYRVRIYAVNSTDPNNLYSENYYPAGSNLSLRIDHKNYNWGFFSFTVSSNTGWNSGTYTSDSQQQFTSNLNQDIDLVLHCNSSDWTKGYDWIKDPYIIGANPVRAASAGRMMMSMRRGASTQSMSQTASAPTLPDPPQNTLYVLDEEYAANPDKITLSGGTWTGKAEDLDAYNEYGPYVYYIASVNESGMPEGTQITISDEVSMDGAAQILTVTNTVPTGDLQITKNILKKGTTDASATGTFYYAVFDEEYNPSANPAQDPIRTGSIVVSSNGTQTVTETDLICGTYYVYELNGENGIPIVSGNDGSVQVIDGICYTVTGSGSTANVGSNAGAAVLTNNQETVDITATKQWKDKNGTVLTGTNIPTNAKVTFTLLVDGTVTSHTVEVNGVDDTAGGVTPATADYEGANWTAYFTGLPKYTNAGTLINYTVQETGTWDGYVVDGNATVSSGGTIINKQQTVEINILKVDKSDGTTPLTGAKFVLKRYNEGYHEVQETWPEQTVSSEEGKKGTLIINGLTVGYYELEETESPAGYIRTSAFPRFEVAVNPTTKELEVIFTDNTGGMVSYDSTNNEFTVRNEPGAALPNAGGPGTTLFTSLGAMLIALAGAGLVWMRKRRSAA